MFVICIIYDPTCYDSQPMNLGLDKNCGLTLKNRANKLGLPQIV